MAITCHLQPALPHQGPTMFSMQLLVFVFGLFTSARNVVAADDRCFLENGGSAENFFVSEDFPVGGVIGTLRIIGDPTENGNITLQLLEQDLPVSIVGKNITLNRRLDKERVNGPSSVSFSVGCDRTNATDPTFVIPVTIRVTDANDNAPQFLNDPFVLNISEATPVGTRVLQGVKAVDADQPGPFSTVQYSVMPGPFSDYFAFPNRLEGTLLLQKPLNYEKLKDFSITICAQDQGSPPRQSNTTVHVNVLDADDQNPQFFDKRYTAVLPEHPVRGAPLLVQPRQIAAFDQDPAINATLLYSFSAEGDTGHSLFEIDAASGRVVLRRDVGAEELHVPATLVLRAAQADNPDRYALTTLTVGRAARPAGEGAGRASPGAQAAASMVLAPSAPAPPPSLALPAPPRFLQRVFSTRVLEPLRPGLRVLTALTNRPHDRRLSFWLGAEADAKDFTVSSAGEVALLRPLLNRTEERLSFTVHVGDGTSNDSARVEVDVPASNLWEPRFRSPLYEFWVPREARSGAPVGRVEAWDGDRDDAVHLVLRGPDAHLFVIDSAGVLRLAEAPPGRDAQLEVVASDSGRPPRVASVPVVVRFAAGNAIGNAGAGLVPASPAAPTDTPASAPLELFLSVLGALLGAGALVVLLLLYLRRLKRRKGRGVLNAERSAEDKGDACNPVFYAGAGDNASFAEAAYRNTVYTATIKPRAGAGVRCFDARRFGASVQVDHELQPSGVESLESCEPCSNEPLNASPISKVTVALVETRRDSVNT